MNPRGTLRRIRLSGLLLGAALLAGAAAPLAAQGRAEAPAALGSGIAGGVFSPAGAAGRGSSGQRVHAALAASSDSIMAELSAAELVDARSVTLSPAAQLLVLSVVEQRNSSSRLPEILGAGGAEEEAAALVRSLQGLLSERAVERTTRTIGEFNQLVRASSLAFLEAPPQEFEVVAAVLNRLSVSLHAAGRQR
jgi:hypothetical protein